MSAAPDRPDLAVALTTFNSMRTIERTLRSVQDVARRIVVVDSGSTDGTIDLCRRLGAEVIHRDWPGYAAQKQFALDQCRAHRWVLLLDSDESPEPELADSLRRALERDDPAINGYEINRKVWFMNGWLHHAFHPDWLLRLTRGGVGRMSGLGDGDRFDPHLLHERLEAPGRIGRLDGFLRHDSWADISDACQRQIRYAQTLARGHASGGKLLDVLLRPPAAMFKQLIVKRGYLDGWRGVIAAGLTANYTLLKHLYLCAHRHRESGA